LHFRLGAFKQIAKSSSAQIRYDQHEFRIGIGKERQGRTRVILSNDRHDKKSLLYT